MVSCAQIDEGIPFKVAGGLMLEHPLTLPFVEAVVSLFLLLFSSIIIEHIFLLLHIMSTVDMPN